MNFKLYQYLQNRTVMRLPGGEYFAHPSINYPQASAGASCVEVIIMAGCASQLQWLQGTGDEVTLRSWELWNDPISYWNNTSARRAHAEVVVR